MDKELAIHRLMDNMTFGVIERRFGDYAPPKRPTPLTGKLAMASRLSTLRALESHVKKAQ